MSSHLISLLGTKWAILGIKTHSFAKTGGKKRKDKLPQREKIVTESSRKRIGAYAIKADPLESSLSMRKLS